MENDADLSGVFAVAAATRNAPGKSPGCRAPASPANRPPLSHRRTNDRSRTRAKTAAPARALMVLVLSFLPWSLAMSAGPLTTLAGSEWGLPGGGPAFVQFGDRDVFGHGGCNRFRGHYTIEGPALTIINLAGTLMACTDDAMRQEKMVLDALAATRTFEATHLKLILKDANGTPLLTLQRRDWD